MTEWKQLGAGSHVIAKRAIRRLWRDKKLREAFQMKTRYTRQPNQWSKHATT